MFLSRDQVEQLTGRKRPSAQVRWLNEHGWAFATRADGRPAVSEREAEKQLETSGRRKLAPAAEPDFTSFGRAG